MTASPYLRPASPDGAPAPCPPGHTTHPAGLLDGRDTEVVFDPRRHDIILLRGRTTPELHAEMTGAGWCQQGGDGATEFWVRDRLAQARAQMERTTAAMRPPRIA